MAKKVYVCEHCGKTYDTRMDARWCEIQHENKDNSLIMNAECLEELRREDKDPCLYCARAYFVYNCEWNCDCRKFCKDYNLFVYKFAIQR